jgi:hypothetical protein
MHNFIAHVGERRSAYKVLVGSPEVMTPLERSRVNRRIILNSILKKFGGRAWAGNDLVQGGNE